LALVVVLLITPWAVRNTVQLDGGLIVLSSSGGTNFWRGHHEGATGGFDSIDPLLDRSKPRDQAGGEADAHQRGIREGLNFLVRNPVEEVKLIGAKVQRLYQGDARGLTLAETQGQLFLRDRLRSVLGLLADGIYYGVLAFAGLAMIRWAREGGSKPLLPVLTIGIVTLGYLVFWGDPRFHFPLMPVFCLLAGWALSTFLGSAAIRSSPNSS
ncbi:MAG: hypothetical protein IID41_08005, partial [Planctomycetes bacterium]|nr:hypothetical protein [Planctomycetota bacterium]